MTGCHFVWNVRLGIYLPSLELDWERCSVQEQTDIIARWELIRGGIPDVIMKLEHTIVLKLTMLNDEEDFEQSCLLNYEIAEYASRINDLQIWYRMNQELETRRHS